MFSNSWFYLWQASLRQSYYAATTYTDYLVGRLLQALEDGGYADNTIISLVGDHGKHEIIGLFSLVNRKFSKYFHNIYLIKGRFS